MSINYLKRDFFEEIPSLSLIQRNVRLMFAYRLVCGAGGYAVPVARGEAAFCERVEQRGFARIWVACKHHPYGANPLPFNMSGLAAAFGSSVFKNPAAAYIAALFCKARHGSTSILPASERRAASLTDPHDKSTLLFKSE